MSVIRHPDVSVPGQLEEVVGGVFAYIVFKSSKGGNLRTRSERRVS